MKIITACVVSACIALSGCATNSTEQNVAIGLGVLFGAALIHSARHGGGGGYSAPTDSEWDWDQYYNQYRQLVWSCRGVQTGEFADNSKCYGKYQTDSRWPQK